MKRRAAATAAAQPRLMRGKPLCASGNEIFIGAATCEASEAPAKRQSPMLPPAGRPGARLPRRRDLRTMGSDSKGSATSNASEGRRGKEGEGLGSGAHLMSTIDAVQADALRQRQPMAAGRLLHSHQSCAILDPAAAALCHHCAQRLAPVRAWQT
jgi:hypothetical protein